MPGIAVAILQFQGNEENEKSKEYSDKKDLMLLNHKTSETIILSPEFCFVKTF